MTVARHRFFSLTWTRVRFPPPPPEQALTRSLRFASRPRDGDSRLNRFAVSGGDFAGAASMSKVGRSLQASLFLMTASSCCLTTGF